MRSNVGNTSHLAVVWQIKRALRYGGRLPVCMARGCITQVRSPALLVTLICGEQFLAWLVSSTEICYSSTKKTKNKRCHGKEEKNKTKTLRIRTTERTKDRKWKWTRVRKTCANMAGLILFAMLAENQKLTLQNSDHTRTDCCTKKLNNNYSYYFKHSKKSFWQWLIILLLQ